ncbi:heme/hemin ABC transporter substrate-binding protein [Vibrio agarivorans]|uniref:heme/hemin ABC transporter substrate-binding protein n=1 Tax=Vibrio agarivorans TaxID=153622 RepID=UPI0025B31C35|nr:ABC transporter substrate-binding protein [Vibrio agarivorans]MDN3662994.1 ABC transporter substrate-binding protein [Vibrio agarivorans]
MTKKTLIAAIATLLVSLPSMAKDVRIISAGSTVTELIYALGAQDKLVAVDSTSQSFVAETDIPQVGYHRQLSTEGLLALAPSIIIGSPEMGPETTITSLKNAGVDVETVSTGIDRASINNRIDQVAMLTDTQNKAQALKADINQRLDSLEGQTLQAPPKVIFVMLSEGRPITVAGQNTPVDAVIKVAGANNPASPQFESYKPMSVEAVLELQPDYILIAERTLGTMGSIDEIIAKMPLLAATPAGANNNIIPIPGRAIIGGFGLESLTLAETLHERFESEAK